ncbi:MAG: HAD family phosphatase [Chloroflexaceae bacterium]|nr:HAD family phosphatase [Chloroflexaceae bacterium]
MLRYTVLASDYDGTLADQGRVDAVTVAALERWRISGGRLVLVTGRRLPDLIAVFPALDRCDYVLAENGALLYTPRYTEERLLGDEPPARLIETLQQRQVEPLYVGRGVVATLNPHESTVREVLRELHLAWQVILNKNDVIVLPPGVHKASGLQTALDLMGVSANATVAVGDAQNDLHMFELCGYAVAVANALPEVKAQADWITSSESSKGVVELIDRLLTMG